MNLLTGASLLALAKSIYYNTQYEDFVSRHAKYFLVTASYSLVLMLLLR